MVTKRLSGVGMSRSLQSRVCVRLHQRNHHPHNPVGPTLFNSPMHAHATMSECLCLRPPVASSCCLAFSQDALYMVKSSRRLSSDNRWNSSFADGPIVPQDRHEAMFTTGGWYSQRQGDTHAALLTQKVEWGISDKLQVSTFVHALQSSNQNGSTVTGMGDFEVGARYSWAAVRSPFTQLPSPLMRAFLQAILQEVWVKQLIRFPLRLLLSQEFGNGKCKLFTSTVLSLLWLTGTLPMFRITRSFEQRSVHAPRTWLGGRGTLSEQQSLECGSDTQVAFTPSYVWRLARRTELLLGVPIGLTSSTDHIGGVVKFTFELGGGGR